ncbi:MAG: class I SAM-dependent methyltransferase, partial [Thermodesulfovibrionales bacterium]|nr:class I SAM-dependent methyltransferase [Thermodesulfovibrionales bacterium]
MPTSPYAHIEYIGYILEQTRPTSILDIGIGNGKIGFISRDLLDVMLNESYLKKDWKVKIDGIEVYEPYIQEHQKFIYDNIYIGDALEVIDRLGKYDLVVLGDVLEHFDKEKGWLLLDKCALHSNRCILVNIPLGDCPQPDIYGNDYERHRSSWFEDEFEPFISHKKIFI